MTQIGIGAAVGSGFSLIRRRPLSILAWGALPALLQGVVIALLAPMYLNLFGVAVRQAQSGSTAPPDMTAIMPQMMMTSGLVQLLNIGQLLLSAVVYCAVFRAVLHPEKSSYAYLRLGGPELFLAVMIFAGTLALIFAMVLLVIPVAVIVGLLAAATHGSAAGMVLMIPLFILAMVVVVVVVGLRFAFVGPMMVDDGKFHFVESWRLSRGRVGSLFLIALCLFGIVLVGEIVLSAIVLGVGFASLTAIAGGLQNLPAFFQQSPAALLSKLMPFLAVYAVAFIPLSGCLVAIFGAPWASAYRDLKPDLSEAFA